MNGIPFKVPSTSFIASARMPGFEFKLFTNAGSSAFSGSTCTSRFMWGFSFATRL